MPPHTTCLKGSDPSTTSGVPPHTTEMRENEKVRRVQRDKRMEGPHHYSEDHKNEEPDSKRVCEITSSSGVKSMTEEIKGVSRRVNSVHGLEVDDEIDDDLCGFFDEKRGKISTRKWSKQPDRRR